MMMNKTGMVHEISRARMIWTSKWVITVGLQSNGYMSIWV